jgi:hypothetical protein
MPRNEDPVKPFIARAMELLDELLDGPHGDIMRDEQNRRWQAMLEGRNPDDRDDEDGDWS